jgi:hypothetical protein
LQTRASAGVTKLLFEDSPEAHRHGKILSGGMVGNHAGDMPRQAEPELKNESKQLQAHIKIAQAAINNVATIRHP